MFQAQTLRHSEMTGKALFQASRNLNFFLGRPIQDKYNWQWCCPLVHGCVITHMNMDNTAAAKGVLHMYLAWSQHAESTDHNIHLRDAHRAANNGR